MRRNGEQATDGEANPSLGAPAGSGIGPAQEDQTGDVPPRVRGEDEQLFGEDSDEEDRQSHPAFSEDERMDPEDRVGAMQVPVRLEEPAKAAGSGLGPEASEDSVGSLVERLQGRSVRSLLSAKSWSPGSEVRVESRRSNGFNYRLGLQQRRRQRQGCEICGYSQANDCDRKPTVHSIQFAAKLESRNPRE